MRRPDHWRATGLIGLAAVAGCGGDLGFRYTATVTIDQPAAFVQLALPATAYRHAEQANLEDLRLVDGRGERVPFAILAPREATSESIEQRREGTLYPLPPRPANNGEWRSPIEVTVQGDRIAVKRLDRAGTVAEPRGSGGWLIDLGAPIADQPPPHLLRTEWSDTGEFTAAFRFETSDDLTRWQPGGAGQLMALNSAAGPLTQASLTLPTDGGRFIRLEWLDPTSAPTLIKAHAVAESRRSVAVDPPTELVLGAAPVATPNASAPDPSSPATLEFDLGGALSVVEIDLRLASGTRVAPVRLRGRTRPDEPWTELGPAVFYRLERGTAEVSTSPPIPVRTRARYLQLVPDPRAAPLDRATTKLVVRAQLASLVFASQGSPPFTLMAGSAGATSSALPIGALVPSLEEERPRFGRASLSEWREVEAVAKAADSRRRMASLRPWLLWGVLVAGVGGLSWMVWRLARGGGAPS